MKLERYCANWQEAIGHASWLLINLKLLDHPSVQRVMQCKGKEDYQGI